MKREKIAVRLLVGLISDYDYTKKVTISDIVKDAFKFTDEFIKQSREKEEKEKFKMDITSSLCRCNECANLECKDKEYYTEVRCSNFKLKQ